MGLASVTCGVAHMARSWVFQGSTEGYSLGLSLNSPLCETDFRTARMLKHIHASLISHWNRKLLTHTRGAAELPFPGPEDTT